MKVFKWMLLGYWALAWVFAIIATLVTLSPILIPYVILHPNPHPPLYLLPRGRRPRLWTLLLVVLLSVGCKESPAPVDVYTRAEVNAMVGAVKDDGDRLAEAIAALEFRIGSLGKVQTGMSGLLDSVTRVQFGLWERLDSLAAAESEAPRLTWSHDGRDTLGVQEMGIKFVMEFFGSGDLSLRGETRLYELPVDSVYLFPLDSCRLWAVDKAGNESKKIISKLAF